ncbi:MAG: FlgD immunoglobulin-like domain containing protein, partial [Candidatus Cloacimonadaceae bacterium]|nr:FlgD immunoglobulin-like domain containing protein [Candidatus Cloacimonadaceae bacterium]
VNNYNSANSRFSILGTESVPANRMQLWDHINNAWIAPANIADGVLMDSEYFGDPSAGTRFWIPVRLNTSTTGAGRYVDDGGSYDGNDSDVAGRTQYNAILPLPPVTAMSGTFAISGKLVGTPEYPLSRRYVILGYDKETGGTLVTATSSAPSAKGSKAAGDYTLISDVPIYRLEVRTQEDEPVISFANPQGWDETIDLGDTTLPVVLSSFTANISPQNSIVLQWITESETNCSGFAIYRSKENNLVTAIRLNIFIPASNTSSQQVYSFTDEEDLSPGMYYYWLEAVDYDGSTQYHGPVMIEYADGINDIPGIPLVTGIQKIYPNPFNPVTRIDYGLQKASQVQISIYNMRGQIVKNLLSTHQAAGMYYINWNGTDDKGTPCTSGSYLVRMQTPGKTIYKKVMLLK